MEIMPSIDRINEIVCSCCLTPSNTINSTFRRLHHHLPTSSLANGERICNPSFWNSRREFPWRISPFCSCKWSNYKCLYKAGRSSWDPTAPRWRLRRSAFSGSRRKRAVTYRMPLSLYPCVCAFVCP